MALNTVLLNVYVECLNQPHNAECYYAECRYYECRYADRRYAECRYAVCRYAECRGTHVPYITPKTRWAF